MDKVPVVQGSYEVTKTDADIAQKKGTNFPKTSTLRPFTITNGSVRMKPKKTTIEKVKPLPKVPENLTANILKLEDVTKPYNIERTTTSKYASSAEEIVPTTAATMILISMAPTREMISSTVAPPRTTNRPPRTTTVLTTVAPPTTTTMRSTTQSTSTTSSTTLQPPTHPTISIPIQELPSTTTTSAPVTNNNDLVTTGEVTPTDPTVPKLELNLFTSAPELDNQPWRPINPTDSTHTFNTTVKEEIKEPPTLPLADPLLNTPVTTQKKIAVNVPPKHLKPTPDSVGYKLLPRNKIRPPVSPLHKTKRPVYYQGYSHPALIYSTQEVERLGTGPVKPYPLPVDKISEQPPPPKLTEKNDFVLNRGEVLPNGFEHPKKRLENLTTTTSAPKTTTETVETTSITPTTSTTQKPEKEIEVETAEASTELYSANSSLEDSDSNSTEGNTQYLGDILLDLLGGDDSNLTYSAEDAMLSRMDEMELPNEGIGVDSPTASSASQETLNFKNIKEYIMATTKQPERTYTSYENSEEESQRRAQTSAAIVETRDQATAQPLYEFDSTRSTESDPDESQTSGYVEVETVQYTPVASWDQPSLFPVQSKWEFVNGTLVQTDRAPMKKVFNDTLQAWIVENPHESGERIEPEKYIRNNSDEIKNISTIFDTLSSKLGIGPSIPSKTPPFTPSSQNKLREKIGTAGHRNSFLPTTAATQPTQLDATTTEIMQNSYSPLPVLLNPNTESYFSSSAENVFGQAEIEEVDPTHFEQMLLLDKVSSFSHRTSTMPSLVTLLPVKSNTGIRKGMPNVNNDKIPVISGAARGFTHNAEAQKLADTAVVVRTNINVSA